MLEGETYSSLHTGCRLPFAGTLLQAFQMALFPFWRLVMASRRLRSVIPHD